MNSIEMAKLAAYIADNYYDDPIGYCTDIVGIEPDDWQKLVMISVRDNQRTAVRACHGPGKTFLAAVINKWWMATRGYPRARFTANTEKQVMSILWSELAKVHRMSKDKELYEWTKTGYFLKDAPDVHWSQAIAWSENNSEAFAGLHAPNVLYGFDEASAIVDVIWEVSQGAMTNPEARWFVMGNPTRNTGKFYECFGKNKWVEGSDDPSLWHCFTISAFDSPRVSPEYIKTIEREYGKDSDPYRVRVLGLPPMQATQQFIPVDLFDSALINAGIFAPHNPKIFGVDVARFGEDDSIGRMRRGNLTKRVFKLHGQDTMQIAGAVLHELNEAKKLSDPYDAVCVDDVGVGGGVTDRLREQGVTVLAVNAGMGARRLDCKNMRAELWYLYKEWLQTGKVDEELRDDSIGIQYSYDSADRLVMERKEDMKKRGLKSPDEVDALCMTFYPQNMIRKQDKILRPIAPLPRYLTGRIN